ncbi:type II toxin-antitoxin system RelE/ParE family toxin [Roseococcus sp. SYP-B2431]|uniref:type II toxin-antitoxin system RelE/ParE family toxin n=1 Tax=Roseococcus sp. SYP-B2431 TaxID=2496640 RepID=UPI001038C754|nr:type II toxin-antitoxin system RelE/ParE family toxin [Roseococcus sp. SYP-B2431]TCI00696.1 type II toxin-antitoxin system RelE/ParE family toxin [Roseococcus sp. SYP-B2431]
MRIVWAEPALRDLEAARTHIARDRPGAARALMELVLRAARRLAEFPASGRQGRRPGTRELVVARTPYLVAYRVRGEVIAVLRVLHRRQQWPDLPG